MPFKTPSLPKLETQGGREAGKEGGREGEGEMMGGGERERGEILWRERERGRVGVSFIKPVSGSYEGLGSGWYLGGRMVQWIALPPHSTASNPGCDLSVRAFPPVSTWAPLSTQAKDVQVPVVLGRWKRWRGLAVKVNITLLCVNKA